MENIHNFRIAFAFMSFIPIHNNADIVIFFFKIWWYQKIFSTNYAVPNSRALKICETVLRVSAAAV